MTDILDTMIGAGQTAADPQAAEAHFQAGTTADIAAAATLSFSNALNLTDGLDGLLGGSAAFVYMAYVVIAFWAFRHPDKSYQVLWMRTSRLVRQPSSSQAGTWTHCASSSHSILQEQRRWPLDHN